MQSDRQVSGEKTNVIGVPIDIISWDDAILKISSWANERKSKYVCICNVHSLVTAHKDAEFKKVIDCADMATPDGAPVAWIITQKNRTQQERINGPDLMMKYLSHASDNGQSIFLYGGSPNTLQLLEEKLKRTFPELKIAGTCSPPYREMSIDEKKSVTNQINSSGAHIVWVGLGCPKQEKWMYEHRGEIKAVMIGVGAAFDYHAGVIKRAPLWMQRNGLEWFHRLSSEPKRLWRRYLTTNILFLFYFLKEKSTQLINGKKDER